MQGGRIWGERDEMRREGACEVGGNWDATWEASRQPSVFHVNTQGGRESCRFRGDERFVVYCKGCSFMKKGPRPELGRVPAESGSAEQQCSPVQIGSPQNVVPAAKTS